MTEQRAREVAARSISVEGPGRGTMRFDRIDIEFIDGRPWMVFFLEGVELARKAFEGAYKPGSTLQLAGFTAQMSWVSS